MALVSGVLTFGLPDDTEFDRLKIFSSDTKDGTYTLDTTDTYSYPELTYNYGGIDENKYYKIQFIVNSTSKSSPLSDAVPGNKFSEGANPFFAITSNTDGVSYGSTQDFYDYTHLTQQDAPTNDVIKALRKSRAYLDLRLNEMSYLRFTNLFSTGTSRRKYNATLELLKETELNLAASIIFKNLSDDVMMKQLRGDSQSLLNVSVGGFSVTENSSSNPIALGNYLMGQALKYSTEAMGLISMINSTEIKTTYGDDSLVLTFGPRFRPPWINF